MYTTILMAALTAFAMIPAILALVLCPAVVFAAANISTTELTSAGLNFNNASQAASPSSYFKNDGETVAAIHNRQAAAITATVVTAGTSLNVTGYGPISLSDVVVSIPASSIALIGPFPPQRFNSGGLTRINLTSTTSVSMTTFKLPK